MDAPNITDRLVARLSADWLEEPFNFFVGDLSTPDDFTGCSITGGLFRNGVLLVDLASAGGRTVITDTPASVSIRCPLSALVTPAGPGPGTYSLALSLVTPGGDVQDLIGAVVELVLP